MKLKLSGLASALAMALTPAASYAAPDAPAQGAARTTVPIPAFDMPMSGYMSEEAKTTLQRRIANPFPSVAALTLDNIAELRRTYDERIFREQIDAAKARFPVKITEERIGGILCDVIEPANGVSPENARKVLINIHGGGYVIGGRTQALLESIPVAAVGGFKVISVDYRMAPEYKFPAGAEDVEAVYRELMKTYRPGAIGIYGVSAGGFLTPQVVARFMDRRIPLPGAIGVGSAGLELSHVVGDSDLWAPASAPVQAGVDVPLLARLATENGPKRDRPYFEGMDLADWRISPGLHPDVLARFPPTILTAGSRDWLLSRTTTSHLALKKAGAKAELYVWEGMWHGWNSDVNLPEAMEYYQILSDFFKRELK